MARVLVGLKNEELHKTTQIFNRIPMRQDNDVRKTQEISNFPLLGCGTTRMVFDIGEGKVLKVADTPYGCVQNYNEMLMYILLGNATSWLCPVHWIDSHVIEDARFLVMTNGEIPTPECPNELFETEECLAEFLQEFGICSKELKLSQNWIGMNLIDYGSTVDSNPISVDMIIKMFEDATKNNKN